MRAAPRPRRNMRSNGPTGRRQRDRPWSHLGSRRRQSTAALPSFITDVSSVPLTRPRAGERTEIRKRRGVGESEPVSDRLPNQRSGRSGVRRGWQVCERQVGDGTQVRGERVSSGWQVRGRYVRGKWSSAGWRAAWWQVRGRYVRGEWSSAGWGAAWWRVARRWVAGGVSGGWIVGGRGACGRGGRLRECERTLDRTKRGRTARRLVTRVHSRENPWRSGIKEEE